MEHGGASSLGTSAMVRWVRDAEVTCVLLCNRTYAGGPLAQTVIDGVTRTALGAAVELPPPASAAEPPFPSGTFRLPGGGVLSLESRAGELCAVASGQDAVDAVVWGGASHGALNEEATRLVEAALGGDLGPLRGAAGSDPARLERFAALLRPHAGAAISGAVTAPAHLAGAAETRVRLSDGDAIGVFWRGGGLLGIAESLATSTVAVPLARVGDSYAAFHLRSEAYAELDISGGSLRIACGSRSLETKAVDAGAAPATAGEPGS